MHEEFRVTEDAAVQRISIGELEKFALRSADQKTADEGRTSSSSGGESPSCVTLPKAVSASNIKVRATHLGGT